MAESLAVLGVAANVIAVVEFGTKVLKRLEAYREAVQELPDTFNDAYVQVGLLVGYFSDVQEADRSGVLSQTLVKRIKPAILACEKMVKELNKIFANTLPEPNASRTQRKLKALGSLRYDGDVEKIMQRLERYKTDFILNNPLSARLSPGARPSPNPLSTVPKRRDPNWVDRPNITTQIDDKCREPAARVALVGIGGIGKSSLAIDYSHRLRTTASDTWVFWVHAGTLANIEKGFQDIAEKAHIPGWHAGDSDRFKIVSNWLSDERNGRWLMIIDNADNLNVFVPGPPAAGKQKNKLPVSADRPTEDLRDYLPQSANGSYLITSRDKNVVHQLAVNHKDIISVEPMDEGCSIGLFKNIFTGTAQDSEITALVDALGHIPLAITQAASSINIDWPRETVPRYLAKLQKGDDIRAKLLEESVYDARRDGTRSNSIIATWHISFERIRQLRPSAARLLSLMSLFNRQGIPEKLLTQNYDEKHLGAIDSRRWWRKKVQRWKSKSKQKDTNDGNEDFDADWSVLNAFSMIATDMDGEHFSMHGLVQFSTKKWLEVHGQFQAWTKRYIWLIFDTYPEAPCAVTNMEICKEWFLHLVTAVRVDPTPDLDTIVRWTMLIHRSGLYAKESYLDEEAEAYFRAELHLWEGIKKRDPRILDKFMFDCMISLTSALESQFKYEEAAIEFRRLWELQTNAYGPGNRETLHTLMDLVLALKNDGQTDEAEALCRHGQKLQEDNMNIGEPNVGRKFDSQALFMWKGKKHYKEAELMKREAFERRRKTNGDQYDDEWFADLVGLATYLISASMYSEAEPLLREALEYAEGTHGRDESELIEIVSRFRGLFLLQNRYADAEPFIRRLIAWNERADCDQSQMGDDPRIERVTLAYVLCKQREKSTEAETLSRALMKELEDSPIEDDTYTAAVWMALANALYQQERYEEASVHSSKAYTTVSMLPDDHPDKITFGQDHDMIQEALARSRKEATPTSTPTLQPPISITVGDTWTKRMINRDVKAELKASLYRYLQPKASIPPRPNSSSSCRYHLSAPDHRVSVTSVI